MKNNKFVRNIATLMSGTAVAQIFPILLSPILTRIYSAEEFGSFANYVALVSIGTIFATAKYEFAVTLPKRQGDANSLVVAIFGLSLAVSVAFFLVTRLFKDFFEKKFGLENINGWNYYIFLSILVAGTYQGLYYFALRAQKFRRLAANKILQNATVTATHCGLGWGGFTQSGLIIGQVVGQIVGILNLGRCLSLKRIRTVNIKSIIKVLNDYKNLPKITLPSSLINSFYNSSRYLLLALVFQQATIGQLYLAFRILAVPGAVIGATISDVLFEKVSGWKKSSVGKKYIFSKLLLIWLSLASVAIVPSCIVLVYGDWLFGFAFGRNWLEAGNIAKILMIGIFFEFTVSPFCRIFFIYKKDAAYLIWENLRFIIIYTPLFASHFVGLGEIPMLWMMSLSTALSYALLLVMLKKIFDNAEK